MSARVAPAWLLEYSSGRFAALALQSTLALLEKPTYSFVPGAPVHCLGLMRWEGRRLPLVDLERLGESANPISIDASLSHAIVLAWKQKGSSQRVELGAIAAPQSVMLIQVRDEQECPAPEDSGMLRLLAASWFEHAGQPVAVLDTAKLFSGWLAGARAAAPVA